MTAGEKERWESGGSKGRDNGETALVLVDLDVPLAPGLGRGEHTTTTAHVTEGSLARTVGSTTTDTGNTSDGTTGTPRLSGGLVTSLYVDSVRLPLVLGDAL